MTQDVAPARHGKIEFFLDATACVTDACRLSHHAFGKIGLEIDDFALVARARQNTRAFSQKMRHGFLRIFRDFVHVAVAQPKNFMQSAQEHKSSRHSRGDTAPVAPGIAGARSYCGVNK